MSTVLQYSFSVVVLAMLISYFLEIVSLFGIFYGMISFIFDLFVCFGADVNVATSLSLMILAEILYFLLYTIYYRFFK